MKYRILKPNEIEAYNIGYQVGSRQTVIADIEWESPEEKKLYRQGYNAGCQDRRRHNVNTEYIESKVSNVSNVKSGKSVIVIDNTIEHALKIIKEYDNMIKELDYDEVLLQEAVVFKDVSKQANRIKCAMIGYSGLLELLDSLKAGGQNG